MKIILIDPPFYRFIGYYNRFFPLGLASLAAVLRQAGHEVLIYDADCNREATKMEFSRLEDSYPEYIRGINDPSHKLWHEARSILTDFNPDIVGITMMTTKAASAFRLSEICKSINSKLTVIVGGPHPTLMPEEVLKNGTTIDIVLRGEGERAIVDLINAIQNKLPLSNVPSISYRENGNIRHNASCDIIENLDALPLPARDLLWGKDTYTSEDMGLLFASRACPFNCTFCSSAGIWGRRTRYRSIKNIIDEIKSVQKNYGTLQFSFKDDTFTLDKRRVLEFCHALHEENIDIKWDCNARINLIDAELLKTMKQNGCNGLKVGIESGSDRILQLMQKGITTAQIREKSKVLNQSGIHWTGYFMMGLPTETAEEMRRTARLMREIKPDFASLSVYEPFPGTALFNLGIDKALAVPRRRLTDFYSLSPKYYYIRDPNRQIDTMSQAEFEAIEREIKKKFHRYNMGPARILKRLRARSALYRQSPCIFWGDCVKFLAWVNPLGAIKNALNRIIK